MDTENKNNFRCPVTGDEFFISNYTIGYTDKKAYRDGEGKALVNPDNGEPLIEIEKEGEFNAGVGTFTGKSTTEKKKVMKKRSAKHNAEQKDRFHSINRGEEQ